MSNFKYVFILLIADKQRSDLGVFQPLPPSTSGSSIMTMSHAGIHEPVAAPPMLHEASTLPSSQELSISKSAEEPKSYIDYAVFSKIMKKLFTYLLTYLIFI